MCASDAKKKPLKPWLKKTWCIGHKVTKDYVWRMEDILDLYELPFTPECPLVCLDERPCALIGDKYAPLPMTPTRPCRREDFEYVRNGSCTVFLMFEPQARFRHVEVRQRRTAQDFAEMLKLLADDLYPQAPCIRLVLDNLSTHTPTALYDTFSPEEAHRLKNRFEFHYTPVHASWLNMVEIELSVLSRQCLRRRIDAMDKLAAEAKAWESQRNAEKGGVNWTFTTREARVKLSRLYNLN